MSFTLKEIAKKIEGSVEGDAQCQITGVSGIEEAQTGDLTFVANTKYSSTVKTTKASAVIVPQDFPNFGKNIIRCANPSFAFVKAARLFTEKTLLQMKGLHKTALIDKKAKCGKDVVVGPYAVIEAGVEIGADTVICSGCFIGHNTKIGSGCLIYPNVTIREKILMGNRVIVHSGTVIGSDGFGFVTVDGTHEKIPQMGTVEIQDDVEIGANVTIDRARFAKTVIGKGTKIDNLVQIAHNVKIGEHCIIVSQVGISGSSTLEDHVTLAGQVGVAGHLTIGKNTIVASKSGIPSDVPPNSFVWGIPAKPHMQAKRVNASLQRLPEYVKTINLMKTQIKLLEEEVDRLKKSHG